MRPIEAEPLSTNLPTEILSLAFVVVNDRRGVCMPIQNGFLSMAMTPSSLHSEGRSLVHLVSCSVLCAHLEASQLQ